MKKSFLLFLVSLALICCESEGELTRTPVGSAEIPPESVFAYSGDFLPTSGISVMGSAKIFGDGPHYRVALDNFSISSGPDLKVYLSKINSPTDFVNLGALGTG